MPALALLKMALVDRLRNGIDAYDRGDSSAASASFLCFHACATSSSGVAERGVWPSLSVLFLLMSTPVLPARLADMAANLVVGMAGFHPGEGS